MKKSTILWIGTVVFTLLIAVYQRMTGPTYPIRGDTILGTEAVHYKLLRSQNSGEDAEIKILVKDNNFTGTIKFKRFNSYDDWSYNELKRDKDYLIGWIPQQPPAGKVIYEVFLTTPKQGQVNLTDEPVVIRFKGAVPAFVLIPHILLMFLAMVYSTRTGLGAFFREEKIFKLTLTTCILLFFGGMFLGPVVQKYAFGAFWTGWPLGHDLTDNKTAVAMIMWIIALWRVHQKPEQKWWVITAAIMLLAVYLVPHSVLGSELDYTKLEP